jgi:uncharacterized membrane protein YphA (DoxX/SURF4 family)
VLIAAFGLRLILAVVFGVAAIGKLRDVRGFTTTLTGFGVPGALRRLLGVAVPGAELVATVLLLVPATVTLGALVAAALLAIFSAATASALSRGAHLDCACFGAASTEPIGAHTLIRNAVLAGMTIAVLVASRTNHSASAENALGAGVGVLAALLVAAAWNAGRLRAENRTLTMRIASLDAQLRAQAAAAAAQPSGDAGGLAVGTPAPPFELPMLEGDRASLTSLVAAGRPVALIFVSAHCPVCHELWPDIERWQTQPSALTVAVVGSGSDQTLELKLMGHSVTTVLLEGDTRLADAYALTLKPSAVIVGVDGRIASRSVAGVGAVRALVGDALGRR